MAPLVLPIAALVLANRATEQIIASDGRLTGNGLVLAARIMAAIGLLLTPLWFVLTSSSRSRNNAG